MNRVSSQLSEKISPERCALVVIDMQNDYAHPEGAYGRAGADLQPVNEIVPRLKHAIEAAHRVGVMVIFTRNWKSPWHASRVGINRTSKGALNVGTNGVAETWGADWFGVAPSDQDIVIDKRRYDAFQGTDLDQILRAQEIESIVFVGVQTNVCVESTARSAYVRDYNVIVLEDATTTTSEAVHRASLANLANYFGDVVTADKVVQIWADYPARHRNPVAGL